jgi:hypothetical protein
MSPRQTEANTKPGVLDQPAAHLHRLVFGPLQETTFEGHQPPGSSETVWLTSFTCESANFK